MRVPQPLLDKHTGKAAVGWKSKLWTRLEGQGPSLCQMPRVCMKIVQKRDVCPYYAMFATMVTVNTTIGVV